MLRNISLKIKSNFQNEIDNFFFSSVKQTLKYLNFLKNFFLLQELCRAHIDIASKAFINDSTNSGWYYTPTTYSFITLNSLKSPPFWFLPFPTLSYSFISFLTPLTCLSPSLIPSTYNIHDLEPDPDPFSNGSMIRIKIKWILSTVMNLNHWTLKETNESSLGIN